MANVPQNVSGYVRPGQFLAIMGPSGSGKTTLLNLLAQRVRDGKITGDIHLNGQPVPKKAFKVISAYVQQDDLLFANLTVKETLDFTASLKMSKVRHLDRSLSVQIVFCAAMPVCRVSCVSSGARS